MPGMLWRVGHKDDPAGFVPHAHTTWENRWDDPEQTFRTSYAAETVGTALVEVFQHYRPTVQAQTTRGELYPSPYLYPSDDLLPCREHLKALLGPSKWAWRAVVAVEIDTAARVLDLIKADRGWLEREIPEVLQSLEIEGINTNVLTSPNREATQRIARAAYEKGIAGFRYPSNAGEVPCIALFEGRGRLKAIGTLRSVTPDMAEAHELLQVDVQLIHREDDDNTDELAARGTKPHT
jgi:hypothetical protein